MMLQGKRITVGLTGGIACYKVPYLVRMLVREGAEVRVVMTAAACKFITPLTLETVSGHPVSTELFPDHEFVATRHIDLAQNTDLIIIAPATANFLGKTANGISDDLLTTVVCAAGAPILVAPAMNPKMWHNPVTQRNIETLEDVGCSFVGPDEGAMACESSGVGRMVEPEEIFDTAVALLGTSKKKALIGKRLVITAGPTREPIDPVRFISNHSSGKMGYALARAAISSGAEVTLITGPTAQPLPVGCEVVKIGTTDELREAVKKALPTADGLIMAAAPADYQPTKTADKKLKKGNKPLTLDLTPTVDILKSLTMKDRKGKLIVGFALETDHALEHARRKLTDKKLDMIIVNRVGTETGFDSDTNQVTIIVHDKKPEIWPLMTKDDLACKLIDSVARLL